MARRAPLFEELEGEYTQLLGSMELRPEWVARINSIAAKLYRNRDRYQLISAATGVPWIVIALAHERESGARFDRHLHNGDPLTARTVQVPPGRPAREPRNGHTYTFEESAVDAVAIKGWGRHIDWTDERCLFELERFNGWGYRGRHPSPYVWSGTTHYVRGKYIRDHVYSATAVDQQVGIAPVMRALQATERPELHPDIAVGPSAGSTSGDLSQLEYSSKYTILTRVRRGLEAKFTALGAWMTYENAAWAVEIALAVGAMGLITYLLVAWLQSNTRENYRNGTYTPGRHGGSANGDFA